MSIAEDPAQFASAAPDERGERRPVSLHGFVALADGRTAAARIVDLSYDGCAIATPLPVAAGETVSLSVLRRGAIAATVRWAADGKAGLAFTLDTTVRPHRTRAEQRVAVAGEVVVRRIGHAKYRVNMHDLSAVGAKIDLIDRPRVGEHLLIKFSGIEVVEAEVCWVEGFFAGVRFNRPFHPIVFELLAARLRG